MAAGTSTQPTQNITVKVGGTQRIPRMPPDFKTQEMAALAQAKDTAANRKTNALADMN